MIVFKNLLIVFIVFFCFNTKGQNTQPIIFKQITDSYLHEAFTSLAYFKGNFYLTYREGINHNSLEAKIIVQKSKDGLNYNLANEFEHQGFELRDPKILSIKDSLLVIIYLKRTKNQAGSFIRSNVIKTSLDGKNWSPAIELNYKHYWLWSIGLRNENEVYSVGFKPFPWTEDSLSWKLSLFKIKNLNEPHYIADLPFSRGYPNESDFIFENDSTILTVIRNEFNNFLFGELNLANLSDGHLKESDFQIGGPKLFKIENNFYLACRILDPDRTAILQFDQLNSKWDEVLTLPSYGDTGYPGVVIKEHYLYLSYYSTKEDKTNVFIAKINIASLSKDNSNNLKIFALLEDNTYIYPNPFDNYLNINVWEIYDSKNSVKFKVFSKNGQLIEEHEISSKNKSDVSFTLNTTNYLPGLYTLLIEHNDEISFKKIVKL